MRSVTLVLFVVFIAGCTASGGIDPYKLADCMSTKNVTMYGTDWCTHCQTQKSMFSSAFKEIDYVDCDKYEEKCEGAGVRGYPTWIIDGNKYEGTQELGRLAYLTKCDVFE